LHVDIADSITVPQLCSTSIILCVLLILGEAMERGLRECCRSIRIGKILIRHDPDTNEPKLYYAKFPSDIDKMNILLLFPNLGEG